MTANDSFIARGERAGNARLTEQEVIDLRERYAEAVRSRRRGVTMKSLAAEYGISVTQVKRILTRAQWVHV